LIRREGFLLYECLEDDKHNIAELLKYLVKLGCIRQAKDIFNQYRTSFPRKQDVYFIAAAIAIAENRFAEAEHIVAQGLAIDCGNSELICQAADIYNKTGRLHQAIYKYQQALVVAADSETAKINTLIEDVKQTSEYITVQQAIMSIFA